MPRAGLTRHQIVETAAAMVDRHGIEGLSLAGLADALGVRSPSLYNHIEGLEPLRREVALRGIDELAEVIRSAVMGRAGGEALHRMAAAYRQFATDHPGVYPLTQLTRPDDTEYRERAARALEPVLSVLAGMGFEGEEAIHLARAVRSALHGFVMLETSGGFGIPIDPGVSFDLLVRLLVDGLADPPDPAVGGRRDRTSQD